MNTRLDNQQQKHLCLINRSYMRYSCKRNLSLRLHYEKSFTVMHINENVHSNENSKRIFWIQKKQTKTFTSDFITFINQYLLISFFFKDHLLDLEFGCLYSSWTESLIFFILSNFKTQLCSLLYVHEIQRYAEYRSFL